MKNLILIFLLSIAFNYSLKAQTSHMQSGYYKPSTGKYVMPHMKTEINNTNLDNFSTKGNTNIYTGQNGSRAQDFSNEALNYGSGKIITTGERGGQYYINNNGNKTYVPKRGGGL